MVHLWMSCPGNTTGSWTQPCGEVPPGLTIYCCKYLNEESNDSERCRWTSCVEDCNDKEMILKSAECTGLRTVPHPLR
ncbi:hypothetical protein L596_024585 [Steinernema carpocapsae]|uniref:Uncharacterized protein n=1 Tax=Steinernema carpocapsae TaxID=34508 RepID=A0A4V5ZZR9_STECR|nr:hypothetical protein L596_024585 [Steinernema carpocapsae]